ncbi:MAG: DUF1653 domain-containing protein [Prevotella sp.]|nr:DUF1653 domain-containing protein [Prevotella sp.]
MSHWIEKTNIYHIYPLGFCGCEKFRSEFTGSDKDGNGRILKVIDWIPHLKKMNFNAVYFGPVFESFEHGYDTTDYYTIDRRLGTNGDFKKVCDELHKNGIRVILDGVFNHVGRDHAAFRDLQQNGQGSRYKDWFAGVNFGGRSPYGDSFSYEGWSGHYNLVKLNLYNNEVVEHLFGAVKMWIEEWGIDGIRFDAADCLAEDFIKRIHRFTRELRPDFWLMGEIIHGQYNRWANGEMFDCVTNYQCYKGIYSSHNDRNYFEIAHSIEYQHGQYGNIYMYNFLDNHDVARLMSVLKNPEHAECCYTMMYGMYGVPSVYYGSEFGIRGEKGRGEDADRAIRPCLDLDNIPDANDKLMLHISELGAVRLSLPAIQSGSYAKIELKNQTFLFKRELNGETVYIALNISDGDYTFRFGTPYGKLADRLSGRQFTVNGGNAEITVPKNKSMILVDGSAVQPAPRREETAETVPEAKAEAPAAEVREVPEVKAEIPPKNNGIRGLGVPEGRKIVIGGHYRHFKGGEYVVLNVAKDHETCAEQAVYMQIHDKPIVWVRPLDMFLEDVDDHGNVKPRFDYIPD